MLRNYLTVALRALAANRLFSAINILGLAVGLACCILIVLFVLYETSYDRLWQDSDRTWRVTREFTAGEPLHLAAVAPPIGPLLAMDFPEIEAFVRIRRVTVTVAANGLPQQESNFAVADPNLFEFLGIELLAGDPAALERPDQLVLSVAAANRYFGRTDVVGETVRLLDQVDATVAGVMPDFPDNSHMALDVVASIKVVPLVLRPTELENWGSNNYYTYLRMADAAAAASVAARFTEFLPRHLNEQANQSNRLHLMPLHDIHLHSDVSGEWQENGSMTLVRTFSAIALVVLLVACINFMNLTTARASLRAREVGLRKVAGATRGQLVAQFLGESVLITAFAMLLALAMVELALPWFGAFLEKPLQLGLASAAFGPLWLPALVLLVGLLAGSYPALVLSAFSPAAVLRGGQDGPGAVRLRQALVVFQFAVSIGLMVATGVVMVQTHYARTMELGYDRDQIIRTAMPFNVPLWQHWPGLQAELLAHPGITSVTLSSRAPGTPLLDGSNYYRADRCCEMEQALDLRDLKVDWNWYSHYRVPLLAGRTPQDVPAERRYPDLDDGRSEYPGIIVLTREGAARAGWTPEQAVGQLIREPLGNDQWLNREVIGVVEDFRHSSVYEAAKPVALTELHPRYGRQVGIRLAGGDPGPAISHIEQVLRSRFPGQPVSWQFLDTVFDALYRSEERQALLFGVFSMLAIAVATLGLFGLASFTTARRTREIGIRKVMGARVQDIVLLLTGEFSRLVLLATLLAWPLAWWLMAGWLDQFVYAVAMPVWVFGLAGVVGFAVAWLTVAGHAAMAASAHPVNALRVE